MTDNNFAAVGAIVLREDKVLLVRHTYGSAAGKLLNPGGMLKEGELPYEAVKREVFEETEITSEPVGLIAVRRSATNWYMAFLCRHIAGEVRTEKAENSESIYMDCSEVMNRSDVTETAKALLIIALSGKVLPMQNAHKERVLFAVGELI